MADDNRGMWLVVGLGNPGPKYERTRHNLGFMAVAELAARSEARVSREECRSLIGRVRIGGEAAELCKPQTYMNLSGEAVKCLIRRDDRSVSRLIVISDDLALPVGSIRVRPRGSHGGQNGLRSIIEMLGTDEFIRVRIGIGPDHPVANASDFVLGEFTRNEAESIRETLIRAADAVERIVTDGIEAAMAAFN